MFPVENRILSIFDLEGIFTDVETIIALEQYKFMPRKTIINKLITYFVQEGITDKSENIVSLDYIENHDSEFKALEDKYNILIKKENTELLIISSVFTEPPKDQIGVALYNYTLRYVYLTPYNYMLLKAPSLCDCNALLVYRRLIYECVKLHATDLHFDVSHTAEGASYTVRYRKGWGPLVDLPMFDISKSLNASIIHKLIHDLTAGNEADLNSVKGIQTSIDDIFGDSSVSLRITANSCFDGYTYVTRILPRDINFKTIDKLGLPLTVQQKCVQLAHKKAGLTLVTGAKCVGKSTTLRAIVAEVMKDASKIIEYSSPIEVLMPFPQIDYANNIEMLENLTRLAKKQDVDVVFLAEIPDKNVAFAVQDLVNASVHVLTTMHIDRIWHLPYKLFELYGEDYKNLITQINGVVNQKAFGQICKFCAEEKFTKDISETAVRELLLKHNVKSYKQPVGCDHCKDSTNSLLTGYVPDSFTPYAECIIFDNEFKSELLKCSQPYEMEQLIYKKVMSNGTAFEQTLVKGISDGELAVTALRSIL